MRFVHANKERSIIQLTKGDLAAAFIHVSDVGIDIKSLPGEPKSRTKHIEWQDLMVINGALAKYDPEEGPLGLEFVLGLAEAASLIFGDHE